MKTKNILCCINDCPLFSYNSLNQKESVIIEQNIINFLDNLSQEAKIFISFGSHDEWDYLSKSVTKKYNTLKNTIEESLKDNSQICFKENIPYILDKNKTLTIINPSLKYAINRDNKEEIISDEVNKYTFLKNLDKDKYNILLCHYPNFAKYLNEAGLLKNVDLVISGHNHNGMTQLRIFPLEKILNLLGLPYQGIITPNKSFKIKDTKNLRGFISLNKRTSLLINPAVTSLGNTTKILQYGDFLFYNGGSIINYSEDK